MQGQKKAGSGQNLAKAKPDPCSFVIFGATGDLTDRLVIPALYNLAAHDLLPEILRGRYCPKGMSNDELRDSLMKGLRQYKTRPIDDAIAKRLLECVTCIEADPNDPASFDRWRERLEKMETNRATGGNRLFYLATPPAAFAPIAKHLGRAGMLKENGHGGGSWSKSPSAPICFGESAQRRLLNIAEEQQIYRIDHYLGKETVQNILVLRFANGMFEPIWNRNHIDHVQITVERSSASAIAVASMKRPVRCATWCRTICFSCVADRDGAAGQIRGPRGTHGKSQGAARDPDPDRRRSSKNSVRGQYKPARAAKTTSPIIARPRTSSPTARRKPMPR